MSAIRTELDALFQGRKDVVNELKSWSEDKLTQQPAEGEWCALEVIDHIISSERGTLGYLVKKTSSGWDQIPQRTPQTDAAAVQLHAALESDGKWCVPVKFPPPAPDMTLETLAHSWMHSHNDIAHWIGATPDGIEEKLVFKHPIAGRITLEQTLGFLQRHITHHRFQLVRIKAAIS